MKISRGTALAVASAALRVLVLMAAPSAHGQSQLQSQSQSQSRPQSQQQQPQPSDLQTPIALHGAGPFYRLVLPIAICERAALDDLRDVQVRNAVGQAVPFAWLDPDLDTPVPRTASLLAPLFAVPVSVPGTSGASGTSGTSAPPEAAAVLKLLPDGSLGWMKAPLASPTAGAVMQWIIDASRVDAALVQARFELAPGLQGLFPFTLEGSDDLRSWRPIGADDQLVRLQQGDRSIERLAIEIDHLRVRYLRLRWHDPARAPALAGVWLDSVQGSAPAAALEWSPEVPATACGADYCDYPVPRHLPIQSLRIDLAEPNTLAPLRIFSLAQPAAATARRPRNALYVLRRGGTHRERDAASTAAPESWLADTVAYRLAQPGGEARSASVPMDGGVHATLRLRTQGPVSALGATPPRLSFGARPRTLVFLAQGQPPFTLRWNAPGQPLDADAAGPLPLGTLMPGYRADLPFAADVASVSLQPLARSAAPAAAPSAAPAASANRPSASTPSPKIWLWAALGAGMLVLAAMAVSLLRGLSNQRATP